MDGQTLDSYNKHAALLADQYNSVKSPFLGFFEHFFQHGEDILDVGCGTGRDVAALLEAGYQVWGLEPSKAFVDEVQCARPELQGRVLTGHLPDGLQGLGDARYDGILLSAVLMHIPNEEFFSSALALKRHLKLKGRLVISHCTQRPGLLNQRDEQGRLFNLRSPEQVRLMFEALGLEQISQSQERDAYGRSGIVWQIQVFQWTGDDRCESIDRIETIVNNDRKVATYKLALLRAVCDVAQLSPQMARWREGGTVAIPLEALADCWMEYYLPLVDSDPFLPQIQGEQPHSGKPIAFRNQLHEIVRRGNYGGPQGLAQYLLDRDRRQWPSGLEELYYETRKKVGDTIIKGPVRYSSGHAFDYDHESRSVVLEGALWREFILLGHWIRDSLLIRWAHLIQRFSGGRLNFGSILALLMEEPEASRRVTTAKEIYQNQPDLRCVWSGQPIDRRGLSTNRRNQVELHIDHAIPFSLRHDNSLWNLLPSRGKVNLEKRDRLPGPNLLIRRRDSIIHCWQALYREERPLFLQGALRLMGRSNVPTGGWENLLYQSFSETIESTAVLRGVERWDG